jgi:choline dehydrogenase-like flavoprotein
MPTIVGGHTHAAAVMIGEKAADMVAADARA